MSKTRYEVTGTLEVLSPLHIGSGEFGECSGVVGKDEAGPPLVALLVRDYQNKPILPSTSLKGMLRGLAVGTLPEAKLSSLFGEIKNTPPEDKKKKEKPKGRAGQFTVFFAHQKDISPDAQNFPYPQADGTFVAARTKIDSASGVADDGTLFFQEMIPPGTTFTLRCRLEISGQRADNDVTCQNILDVLALLCDEQGVPLGKGTTDGFGRVKLRPEVSVEAKELNPATGEFKGGTPKKKLIACPCPQKAGYTLTLTCEGPFAILDSSRASTDLQSPQDEKDRKPQLAAQVGQRDLPLIPGTSLSGALRARAEWLDNLAVHRKEKEGDNNALVTALFGTTDQRGLLRIDKLNVLRGQRKPMTSVKLDRFSMAPIDNALFTTATFTGVEVSVSLSLHKKAEDRHREFLEILLEDLKDNGLMLGHGCNKGFGWFDVKQSKG